MDITQRPSLSDLAYALFASPLQERDRPTDPQVWAAIGRELLKCDGDCSRCAADVAQEAGDHPDRFQHRMRWALATVSHACPPVLPLAS